MSKAVKSIAAIALPIVGTIIAPGIGTALGSSLSAATTAAVGGAIGGGLSGAVSGGGIKGIAKGAALGGLGGYVGAGGFSGLGEAGSLASGVTKVGEIGGKIGSEALKTATQGASTAATAGSTAGSSIFSKLTQAIPGKLLDPGRLALGIGNQLVAGEQAEAAEEAARLQAEAAQRGIDIQQQNSQPYRELGENAVNQINTIQADKAGYIQNNELYQSLAKDAEQRLLANQAAKGKVGSGGTAAALQDQLLQIGNGLVNQEVGQLQSQASIGGNAATGSANQISNLQTQQGAAQAGGVIGAGNAQTSGYQNQINTLLALQGVNKTPEYQPIQFNI